MSVAAEWQELRFTARKDQVEPLEHALSVTLEDDADQPLLEPGPGEMPLWDAVRLTVLFAGAEDLTPLLGEIPSELCTQAPTVAVPVADREWTRVWDDQFHPSGTYPPNPDAINVWLDPGLGFGTGAHPSTAMCLRALDADLPPGQRVVDYGCGSGILGIAAARLGATKVLGVDNDPQAITASRNNAQRNGVLGAAFRVVLPQDELVASWQASADWVVANILARPLVALAPALTSLMTPGGRLLLAGLLVDQAEAVIEAYAPGVALSIADQQEQWVLLAGEKC